MMRSLIFWAHLVAGVSVGVIILVMSATGVLLTFERQIVEWVERSYTNATLDGQEALAVDEILSAFQSKHPDEEHFFIRIVNRPGAAVPVWVGSTPYLVDAYTGEILREGRGAVGTFFHWTTSLHRWLGVEGDGSGVARAITNYSNLLFFFLVVSGMYLWLPKVWRWPFLKTKIFFNERATNSKARDYNWHNVFAFWALVPLAFIVVSATVIYFPWAARALYAAFGEEVPARPPGVEIEPASINGGVPYATLLATAIEHANAHGAEDWHSIWMQTGTGPDEAEFYVDRSIGNRPNLAYELTMNIHSGGIVEEKFHEDWSRGDRAWDVARFGHTGEWWGVVGQTIAGLASLAACLLVYTGLALAWRRLIAPLWRQDRVLTPPRSSES
jgi:uncharacterized iron-regulated membrane protein